MSETAYVSDFFQLIDMKVLITEDTLDSLLSIKISSDGGKTYTDYSVSSLKNGITFINPVDKNGCYVCGPWEGRLVTDPELEIDIIKYLKENDKLFKKQKITHDYPHCWRCKQPLVYYAKPAWYVNNTKMKDEIIKQTARIILKNVNSDENIHNFVGHIGGDDFVAFVTNENYEEMCQNIIVEFDKKILDYFTDEDKERGYLEVPNRKGIIEEFPLVSISIGVVEVSKGRFHNVLEIGEVGAQVKHLAKVTPGSAYAINRRKD